MIEARMLSLICVALVSACAPAPRARPPSEVCIDDAAACRLVGAELRPAARRWITDDFATRQQNSELLVVYYDHQHMVLVPGCHVAGSYAWQPGQGEVETFTARDATFLRAEGSGFRTRAGSRVRARPLGRNVVVAPPTSKPATKKCRFATHYARELVIVDEDGEQVPIAMRLEPLPPPERSPAPPSTQPRYVRLNPAQVHVPRTSPPAGSGELGEDLEILRAIGVGTLLLLCTISGGDCGDDDDDDD